MKLDFIDDNKEFDFGRVSKGYAKYRDVYPKSMYKKLLEFGIGINNQNILDLGSGTAILPINMCMLSKKVTEEEEKTKPNTSTTTTHYTSTDIAENQVIEGKKMAESLGLAKDIDFKVCGAEDTGFSDAEFDVVIAVQCFHYFDTTKAVPEIKRILKKSESDDSNNGRFCKIFMDWMPYEDEIVNEMEKLVLKYNPNWKGCGFKQFKYNYPEWAEKNGFEIETIHSYSEKLVFEKEAWIGRILTCRGVGASLSKEKVKAFEDEYREILKKYPSDTLKIKHQIHIEIYKSK